MVHTLKRWLQPLEPASDAVRKEAKTSFDTRTSAASFSHTDAAEIKEHSLWLANEAGLDEVTALRIAVLEKLERPTAQLLQDFSDEETRSLQDAASSSTLGTSTLRFDSTLRSTEELLPSIFDLKTSKNLRLVQLYLDERLHVVKIGDLLRRLHVNGVGHRLGQEPAPSWLVQVARRIADNTSVEKQDWLELCKTITAAAELRVANLAPEIDDPKIAESWIWTHLCELNAILQYFYYAAQANGNLPDAPAIMAWFNFVAPKEFFRAFAPANPAHQNATGLLQGLIAAISVSILRLSIVDDIEVVLEESVSDVRRSDLEASYINEAGCIGDLQRVFLDAVAWGPSPASPALFAWALIILALREGAVATASGRRESIAYDYDDESRSRRESLTANPETAMERAVEVIRTSLSEQDAFQVIAAGAADTCKAHEVIATLAGALQSALTCGVDDTIQISARTLMLHLIQKTGSLTGYSTGLVAASIAVADGDRRSWNHSKPDNVLLSAFATPESFLTELYGEAKLRYPFEVLPFLNFSRMQLEVAELGDNDLPSILERLRSLELFTQLMPEAYYGFDQLSPDDDYNLIRLTDDLRIFRPSRRTIGYPGLSNALTRIEEDAELILHRDTEGRIVAESSPHVVTWQHQHSALQYLANSLATVVAGCDSVNASTGASLPLTDASEAINFFAAALESILSVHQQRGTPPTEARAVAVELLESVRDGFQSDRDLLNIILDIFEQQLQTHSRDPLLEGSSETLVSCIHFISAAVKICPGRIWSYLSRSSLLELDGSGGGLVAVIEATEMINGRYDFLIGCLRLYEALVEDAVQNSVARKAAKSTLRFANSTSSNATPDRTISAILLAFTKITAGLFGTSLEWRFASFEDKFEFQTRVIRVLGRILGYVYAFDDSTDKSVKLTATLNEAAEYTIRTFVTPTTASVISRPLLNILFEAASATYDRFTAAQLQSWHSQTQAVIQFMIMLLRTATLLDISTSSLQSTLFRTTPLLARLYAACRPCRKQIIILLETLVDSSARSEQEPPSLLGHMGAESARSFLVILTQLTTSSESDDSQNAVWGLLSAVVGGRQQWFAIYVLTGGAAKDSFKSQKDASDLRSDKTLFKYALDQLSNLSDLNPSNATSLLKFVNLAQNYWPRVIRDIRKHPKFLDGVFTYLGTLKRNEREKDPDQLTLSCHQTRNAALIAQILAMCIHFGRQLGDYSIAENLTPKLSFFKEFAVAAPKYNNSLHSNLKRNIDAKYPGCRLESFKRTDLQPSKFGTNFFFDIEFASSVLDFDPQWSKPHSLQREFPLANVDLSLVEAQIELLQSWKLLAIELSNVSDKVPRLQELLIAVVQKCLEANTTTENPPAVFERLVQVRADFAFALLQRLLRTSVPLKLLKPLFGQVWEAVRSCGVEFETAFAGPNVDYYRSLLKLLFLSLKPHLGGNEAPTSTKVKLSRPDISSMLLEVLKRVIALGFRNLAVQLHENATASNPSDFVLLTALFQSILRVHGISLLHNEIVTLLTSSGVVRYATSLFSWADQLAVGTDRNNPDPIYGELSILFLLELSSIPLMAEAMAVDGVLASLSTAKLCQYYQRNNGVGPFDEPVRLFAIWSKGVLPLALNLLDAVGAPIAAEIASFLNQFAPQLARNAKGLESRTVLGRSTRGRGAEPFAGAVTLGLASETHSLALLSFGLDRAKDLGSAAGVNSADIEDLAWDKDGVKEDIQAWLNGSRALADRIVATTEVEEGLMRNAGTGKKSESQLEEKVLGELRGAFRCLGGEGDR